MGEKGALLLTAAPKATDGMVLGVWMDGGGGRRVWMARHFAVRVGTL